jgi:uncharacterized repeat protein (TIGR03843 family)
MDSRRQETLALLEKGIVLREQQIPTSNCTYLVELGDEAGTRCLAVYKPRDGEAPLWDFPDGTLYRREYLSYLVSEALGWGLVPSTVVREGPYGIGTMQQFIRAQNGRHYFNLLPAHRDELLRFAIFDCVVNNTDRKGGHCLADESGRLWAIDHGLTFSVPPKLRTVMWEFAKTEAPPELRAQVASLMSSAGLVEALKDLLTPAEVEAFCRRVDLVAGSAIIPIQILADVRRPVPWPAI